MAALLDLGGNIADVLPTVLGAIAVIIVIILAGLSGFLVTVGFGGVATLFNRRIRASYHAGNYAKTCLGFIGALMSLTFWIGLYALLFATLSATDFLKSLVFLIFPVLGAFGVLVLPGSDD